MSAPADTRNATLDDLVSVLRDREARKVDIVVPASQLRSKDGVLIVTGAEQEITLDGVTTVDGHYRPTKVCDEGLADKLGIPIKYLSRMREQAVDLYDANVNSWLRGRTVRRVSGPEVIRPADPRSFMVRGLRGAGEGVARALLSDTYRRIDDLDTLMTALGAIRDTGTDVEVHSCSLTERRMYVDVFAPAVAGLAPVLLHGYRNPFAHPETDASRQHGRDAEQWARMAEQHGLGRLDGGEPIVFAGFRLTNSEVGGGTCCITPRLVVQVCTNGMTIQQDAIRNVHLGSRMDEGLIQWSDDTQRKNLELIQAQTRDAVTTFLNPEYLARKLGQIEEKAGRPVDSPEESIQVVAKALKFTEAEQAGILSHFVRGGQMTAGGVLNAVTSFAQTIPDADRSDAVEAQALRVLSLV